MLTLHLLNHEGAPDAAQESHAATLNQHLQWQPTFTTRVVRRAEQRGLIHRQGEQVVLTDRGRSVAQEASVRS